MPLNGPAHTKRLSDLRYSRMAAARAKGRHTEAEWWALLRFCDGCVRCGTKYGQRQKDHILPIYLGGSDAIDNLQPLCRRCNQGKRSESIDYRPEGWREAVDRG